LFAIMFNSHLFNEPMGPRYATLTSTIPVEPFSPPFHISFHRFSFKRFSFIKELLSLSQAQLHLRLPIGKVETKGNECKSLLLNLTDESPDLLLMEKEFSRPQRIMIKSVAKVIRTDMCIDKKNLSIFNFPITVPEIGPSFPERLYLRSHKGNPCLIFIFNRVVMPCLFVLTNQFFSHVIYILANLNN
jgi:hypothetical protein